MNSKDSVTKEKQNKKKKKRRNPFRFFIYDFIKVTGALSAWLWLRPKRLFESKAAKKHVKGGAVAIANHTNVRDPIALHFAFWYRRINIIALQEMFNSKAGGWFFRRLLCIPVNRDNLNMQTFRAALDVLEDGRVLGIFPEGHINTEVNTVQSFKSGAALMAFKANVPIIPVFIAPFTKWYKRTVTVIGEPINPADFCEGMPSVRDLDRLSAKLREKELLLMEIYNEWKKKKSSK